ncbi:MAG: hypothetical protein ACKVZ0_15205 [Gemmatimonadales bacterium]
MTTVLLLLAFGFSFGAAQRVGAHAIGVAHWTNTSPTAGSERGLHLVHPMIMATWAPGGGLGFRATGNLEGLSIPNGEISLGSWGEGFVDRRHPHSYVHELIVDLALPIGCGERCRFGAFAGKGFVPFGSDDPMTRPIHRYPVNHHLAQILERAVVGIQLSAGPATIETALFNGDEPERPGQWPRIGGRFGDSWSARLTLVPTGGLELAASAAKVHSPEHRPGAGADQDKRHLSARYAAAGARWLAEWSRTSELDGFFRFESVLVEAARVVGPVDVALRFERTDRPEEERIEPTRSARPHLENSLLGISRWSLVTVGVAARSVKLAGVEVSPFVELTGGRVTSAASAFDLIATYGRRDFRTASIGARLSWGDARQHLGLGHYGLRRPGPGSLLH